MITARLARYRSLVLSSLLLHQPAVALAQATAPTDSRAAAPAASAPAKPSGSASSAQPSTPAPTEGKDAPSPAVTEAARALWYRGVEAFRAGDYETARLAFEQCYKLMPKTDVLRNLSLSELESGHYVSGARHLAQLLATPGALNDKARTEAEKRLSQAEAQIGRLTIVVDVDDAEVVVDGEDAGRSPLSGPWYVEPGQHLLVVRKPGYPTEQRQLFALAGVNIPVEVSLEALRHEKEAAALAARKTEAPAAPTMDVEPSGISTGSILTLVATSTVAVAGLAGGIMFSLRADDADSDADGYEQNLPRVNACAADTPFVIECQRIEELRNDAVQDRRFATVGFVVFGVATAATIGYALWLGFGDSSNSVEAGLDLGPGSAGLKLRGAF